MLLALGMIVGLTAGNYIWQGLTEQKWKTAFERSFFQAVALMSYLLVDGL